MDGADVKILASLHEDPLASYEMLGRALGMTGAAVKRRYVRLEQDGVLRGVALLPRPVCLERQQWVLHFRPGDDPPPKLHDLLDLPEVYFVKRAHDGGTTLVAALEDDERELHSAASEVFRATPHSATRLGPQRMPASDMLSPLDWRLLRAWVSRPRTTIVDLAKRSRLTVKTVRRRRGDLLARGVVQVLPMVDATRSTGAIFYGLSVHATDPDALKATVGVLKAGGHFVTSLDEEARSAYVWGHASTFVEVTRKEQELVKRPGVSAAHLSVPAGMAAHTERILGWIDERLEAWQRAKAD